MLRLPDGENDAGEAAEEQTAPQTRPAQPGQGEGAADSYRPFPWKQMICVCIKILIRMIIIRL